MSNLGETVSQNCEVDCTLSEINEQLSKILSSPNFRNSPVLASFLRFITEEALAGRASNLNEYAIATQVFCRGADFDSADDTIVRTQAYRLRLKLGEYYGADGLRDRIVIEIPKGHYVPLFKRQPQPVVLDGTFANLPAPTHLPAAQKKASTLFIFLLASCALVLFGLGILIGRGQQSRVKETANAVDTFWTSFLGSERQPIVAYTNALYLAGDSGELIPFMGGQVADRGAMVSPDIVRQVAGRSLSEDKQPLYFEDDMTGIGEVVAAVAISKALERVGAHPSFKRSRLITTYDLQNHNVIFWVPRL